MMKNVTTQLEAEPFTSEPSGKPGVKFWLGAAVVACLIAGAIVFGPHLAARSDVHAAAPPPAAVTVSAPLQKELSARLQFLGQFSAAEPAALGAQVGGNVRQL